jgi:hypothetical protein
MLQLLFLSCSNDDEFVGGWQLLIAKLISIYINEDIETNWKMLF